LFGNRNEKDVTDGSGTTVTRFALDGWNPANPAGVGTENFNVLADLDGSSSLITRYLHGDKVDQLLARIDLGSPNATYWTLTDRLGSVRDVLDNGGVIKDSLRYDGFGNIDLASETNAAFRGRYAWTGREIDVETGLQYNRARYYDPAIGRWISQDPLGFDAGDSNLYRYVNNRPLLSRDPGGLIGVFLEGTDQPKGANTIIQRIFRAYRGAKKLILNPNIISGDFWSPVKEGVSFVEAEIKKARDNNSDQGVDVFGWSRGAAQAILVTRALNQKNINVRYLGLIDPNTAAAGPLKETRILYPNSDNIGRPFYPRTKLAILPDNVKAADVIYVPGQHEAPAGWQQQGFNWAISDYRVLIGVGTKRKSDEPLNVWFVPDVGHWKSGRDDKIGFDLWQHALDAGVPLPANPFPPPKGVKLTEREKRPDIPRPANPPQARFWSDINWGFDNNRLPGIDVPLEDAYPESVR
jgi:RHS repeat-associated protein